MSTRRVRFGDYGRGDGIAGLKISLPGYDVVTDDDDDVNKFSFNSQWTDIARVIQVSTVFVNAFFSEATLANISVIDQGYHVFADFRRWNGGSLFYDDFCQNSTYVQREGVLGVNHLSGMQCRWAPPIFGGSSYSTSNVRVLPRSFAAGYPNTVDGNFYVAAIFYNYPTGL